MELSRKQKLLINGLKLLNVKQRTIEVIMLACQTEEATQEMLQYIVELIENNKPVTEQALLKKITAMN